MSAVLDRREAAYWLTLAFKLEREPRRNLNGLVLTADRLLKLGLSALVELNSEELPEPLRRYAEVHRRLIEAEGKVSAQAFVVDQLLEQGIRVVPITAEAYPAHLARTLNPNRAPTLLSVAGHLSLLREQGVAVCGSRDAGPEGIAFARSVGRALAEQGGMLISGLARGSDREALEGALAAGGRVVGVAPEGILQAGTRKRPELEAGRLTVVSEFAPNDKWSVARAMARNLTIAGLSRALIVADCVAPGGTTDQVEVARTLGIPVFVRRGKGEGAWVAELVRLPGVTTLEWDEGSPLRLPGELGLRPPPAVRSELRWEQDRLVLHVEASARATLEELVTAVREVWRREAGLVHSPMAQPSLAEPEASFVPGPSTGAEETAAAEEQDEKMERVRSALTQAAGDGCTLEGLRAALRYSERVLRDRLKRLEEQGELVTRRKARKHHYFLKAYAPPEPPQPVSAASTKEGSKQKDVEKDSQLGLVLFAEGGGGRP